MPAKAPPKKNKQKKNKKKTTTTKKLNNQSKSSQQFVHDCVINKLSRKHAVILKASCLPDDLFREGTELNFTASKQIKGKTTLSPAPGCQLIADRVELTGVFIISV